MEKSEFSITDVDSPTSCNKGIKIKCQDRKKHIRRVSQFAKSQLLPESFSDDEFGGDLCNEDTTTRTNQKDELYILKSLKEYRRSFYNFMSSDSSPYHQQMTRKNTKFNEIDSPFEQQKIEVAGLTLRKENIFHARDK